MLHSIAPGASASVERSVLAVGREESQVFYPVVINDSVDMVDNFGRKKKAAKVGLHY
jgi:hypothetical protein